MVTEWFSWPHAAAWLLPVVGLLYVIDRFADRAWDVAAMHQRRELLSHDGNLKVPAEPGLPFELMQERHEEHGHFLYALRWSSGIALTLFISVVVTLGSGPVGDLPPALWVLAWLYLWALNAFVAGMVVAAVLMFGGSAVAALRDRWVERQVPGEFRSCPECSRLWFELLGCPNCGVPLIERTR